MGGETEAAIGCRITWLGQAGFLIETSALRVVIDLFLNPWPGTRAPLWEPEDLGPIDLALVTHEHLDHWDEPTLVRLKKVSPALRVMLPAPIVDEALEAGFSQDDTLAAVLDQPLRLHDVTIWPIPSRHGVHPEDGYGFGREGGQFVGYCIQTGGLTLYHSGDTVMYPGLVDRLRQHSVDVCLLPINGRDYFRESLDIVGNLSEREAVELAGQSGAKLLIPMHYETFWENLGNVGAMVNYARSRWPRLSVLALGYGAPYPLVPLPDSLSIR